MSKGAPLISYARFGPGSIIFLSLIAILAAIFYLFKHEYFALVAAGVGAVFFGVKSMEKIRVSRPIERKVVGQTCLVVKSIQTGQQGIVKLLRSDGTLDPELWSAESTSKIREGSKAKVVGQRTIVLLVERLAGGTTRATNVQ